MSLKITDVLSRFGKEPDVSIWISQAHLAKDLLKLEDLAVIIPLFLDGFAFAIYDQLSAEDKKSSDRIEAALKTAIAVDKFNAYEEIRTRMWKPGETVDVFLSDLKRLSKLAEIGDNEEILNLAFVMGLPRQISGQLRATHKLDTLNLPAILKNYSSFDGRNHERFDNLRCIWCSDEKQWFKGKQNSEVFRMRRPALLEG